MTNLPDDVPLGARARAVRGVSATPLAARPFSPRVHPACPRGITGPAPAAAPVRAAATRVDAEMVVYRLEEAGQALLALPPSGYSTKLRTSNLDIVRAAAEAHGWEPGRLRPVAPDHARITRMDEAFSWIPLIPLDRYVLRRIVGVRCLVSPTTERHLYTWRRIAVLLGADHKAIQRWHAQGIALIVAALDGS